MVIWDRAVGYNERRDSFTPAYEMCLMLKKTPTATAYFDKDAIRIPYDVTTIERYLKDPRYRNKEARKAHLLKGRYATNLIRVPSLKGSSKEKVGHPAQKPERLIEILVLSSSRPGDLVLDPFLGSGTTAVVCQRHGRSWLGIECPPAYCQMASARLQNAPNRN